MMALTDPQAVVSTSGQQLTLDVACNPPLTDQVFIEAPVNVSAKRLLTRWREDLASDGSQGILLAGPPASGKSFLLTQVFRDQPALWISADQLEKTLARNITHTLLIVDNAEYAGDPLLLTRLIDVCRERSVSFVIAGSGKPEQWAQTPTGTIKDLVTRLTALPVAMLDSPDQELMKRVLLNWMAARQLKLSDDLADHISNRLKRSFSALTIFTERLDAEALERNKSIDRPLIQTVLSALKEHTLS
ncbi:hypothetical protein [Parvularcula sp. IMCC14364]|uniref:HdaA/DnaA family protein n=1 Tax=Parvularcula sp. IMCC14364 TaxID=3067902 RepID=UPI002740F356|nr:hypothetical protein [Parvularcula sp. IMCC14364]